MKQRRLFDAAESARRREQGIDRAEYGAREWKDRAYDAAARCARNRPRFTTDDVWRRFGEPEDGTEPRAMGAIMRKLQRDGLIEATDEFWMSERVACHRRPLRVWRSLVYTSPQQGEPT